MSIKRSFLQQYYVCFEHNGKVKICGREACKLLISMAQELTHTTDMRYGDVTTGLMEEEALKELYKTVKAELPTLM